MGKKVDGYSYADKYAIGVSFEQFYETFKGTACLPFGKSFDDLTPAEAETQKASLLAAHKIINEVNSKTNKQKGKAAE